MISFAMDSMGAVDGACEGVGVVRDGGSANSHLGNTCRW